jgi:leukotriene A-4 hydrolase/aminopeptidase
MPRIDPHSYADSAQPRTRHLRWTFDVDFETHRLEGTVAHVLAAPAGGPMDLDTKGLDILGVTDAGGKDLPHRLSPEEAIFGSRLRIDLAPGTTEVRIHYRTSPQAVGLQWLAPEQTEGKRQPFLFSQCQAIHARTMVPLQDTPAFRVTYEAEVTVPAALSVVMSAGPEGAGSGANSGRRTFRFRMPQPIPPYLMALAVGDLASRDLGPRSRVWAEPATVEKAAWEFAGMEEMISKAEELFGPYEWDRYDMLVLPPSFPYGGMENPRMTFLTPTLLAGDRSLVDVVCHELAHSWTGNLVTNATADHFWLNEGWTVWAERRILELLHGEEAAALSWAVGEKELTESMARFGIDSPLTRLQTDLAGLDPDEAFSSIPYEKGSRFLALCERTAGRTRWDRFVREYIARFRFTSITTADFLGFLDEKLPGVSAAVGAEVWFHGTGMPENAPVIRSARLDALVASAKGWESGRRPTPREIAAWNPTEMLLWLQTLPRPLPEGELAWLDRSLSLTGRGNYELLVEWLVIAATSDYEPVFPRIREVLLRVGRMKYLRPLYRALGSHPRTRALAREIFVSAAPTYHTLSRRVVEGILAKYED